MNAVTESKSTPLKVLMLDTRGEFFDWSSRINESGRQWNVLRVDNNKAMLSFLQESAFHVIVVAFANIVINNNCRINVTSISCHHT